VWRMQAQPCSLGHILICDRGLDPSATTGLAVVQAGLWLRTCMWSVEATGCRLAAHVYCLVLSQVTSWVTRSAVQLLRMDLQEAMTAALSSSRAAGLGGCGAAGTFWATRCSAFQLQCVAWRACFSL